MHSTQIRTVLCSFCVLLSVTFDRSSTAEDPPFIASGVQTHEIESKIVGQRFMVYVQVPVRLKDGSERFPVLYSPDSFLTPSFSSTAELMQVGGDIPRFISVGIGYPIEHRRAAGIIRQRDLTPTEIDEQEPPRGLIDGVLQISEGPKSGGADKFLRFIREELQPFIDENYPTIPGDRGYFGDSLGGLFGLYVLFNAPDTFNRYVLGSPSIWWDDKAILADADAFVESGKPLDARVFMSVGALEEDPKFLMVTNVFVLESKLRSANIEGLRLSTYLFPNETHTSVIPMNYVRGVQSVYDRPVRSFLQEYALKREAETSDESDSTDASK